MHAAAISTVIATPGLPPNAWRDLPRFAPVGVARQPQVLESVLDGHGSGSTAWEPTIARFFRTDASVSSEPLGRELPYG